MNSIVTNIYSAIFLHEDYGVFLLVYHWFFIKTLKTVNLINSNITTKPIFTEDKFNGYNFSSKTNKNLKNILLSLAFKSSYLRQCHSTTTCCSNSNRYGCLTAMFHDKQTRSQHNWWICLLISSYSNGGWVMWKQ